MNSNSLTKRHHRVMVALTDPKRRSYSEEPCLDEEIKLLDKKAMLLRIPNALGKPGPLMKSPRYYRHMEFDAIGYDFETHIRSELTDLMSQMFRYHRHGSLLRFPAQRNLNPSLLTRLLVTEVEKLMMDLRLRLKTINVDYFDVRKFDMINLLLDPKATRNHRRDLMCGKSFYSTKDLYQWLVNDLTTLRGRAIGDDYLDFEFVYRDTQPRQHKIRLSVFHIFNSEDRSDLAEFLKSVPNGRQCGVSSTLLNDCLKESFDLKSPTPALMMFELPMVPELCDYRRKVLKLADMAYSSLEKGRQLTAKIEMRYSSQLSISVSRENRHNTSRCSLRSVPHIPMAHWRRTAKFSDEDYNGLAAWYKRIDAKFTQLKLGMEQHFVNLFKRKALDLRRELTCINQDLGLTRDESGGDASRLPNNPGAQDPSEEIYNELQREFKSLEQDAERSAYASTLKVYISTKKYELSEAEKTLKQREIENLRIRLVQYISS
ncbi:uncharacterized protein LOC110190949 [Drosophila serrata]|uniref:uncharacterized protein LOC110190949 n=1 Tax=Drosophila serrata TaxID=7274 RepID=UPI000A1D30B1|nr:uncharacterized protein LOC110190949 [Drosophila serrata]